MPTARSVLYLDVEDMFRGLATLDPRLALRYAEEPLRWVDRLAAGSLSEPPRRWLVLRCYLDPTGWVPHPEREGERLYLSAFRSSFTDAGFEVVDCPRLSHAKHGAHVRLTIDAIDALRADVRYDEFVIASSDADLTPLLVRLRAADRRTTLVSALEPPAPTRAVADRLIAGARLAELLGSHPDELDELGEERAQATAPIDLAVLAHDLRRELGTVPMTSRWYDGYLPPHRPEAPAASQGRSEGHDARHLRPVRDQDAPTPGPSANGDGPHHHRAPGTDAPQPPIIPRQRRPTDDETPDPE